MTKNPSIVILILNQAEGVESSKESFFIADKRKALARGRNPYSARA